MSEELRMYRRQLAHYCLYVSKDPISGGDLAEHMGAIAMSEHHPEICWRGINAPIVSGILRSLETSGCAARGPERKNGRSGRPEPTWVRVEVADETVPMMPPPPDSSSNRAEVTAALPILEQAPYSAMTRPQLYTLLRHHDEHAGAIARFIRDVSDINERFRRELSASGLDYE